MRYKFVQCYDSLIIFCEKYIKVYVFVFLYNFLYFNRKNLSWGRSEATVRFWERGKARIGEEGFQISQNRLYREDEIF